MNQEMNSEIKLFSFQEKTNSEKEIQESKESVIKIAKKYNINPKTVQSTKWILFKSHCLFFSFTEKTSRAQFPPLGHESETHSIVK
jgi:hypothetical protein